RQPHSPRALPPRHPCRKPGQARTISMLIHPPIKRIELVVAALTAIACAGPCFDAIARADDTPKSSVASAEGIEFFEKQVRPLLVQHCLACHGEKKKGGLQLDSRAAMLKGSDSGPAIV